ncbi:hypothetical protein KY289_008575 [Solanum tuberosum]|nr:hypothetical protein KY289_008575 [Solanum tuberosum]
MEEVMNSELKDGQLDPNVDLNKLRRRMSNRLSAQRARLRKVEYTTKLEKEVKHFQDTIALMRPIMENAKDSKKKLQLENKILQQQCLSNKSNLRAVQTEELKVELKRLKELEKTQEAEEHMETEGQSSHSYDHDFSELAADIDVDQYLNLDNINFSPSKNDNM